MGNRETEFFLNQLFRKIHKFVCCVVLSQLFISYIAWPFNNRIDTSSNKILSNLKDRKTMGFNILYTKAALEIRHWFYEK